MVGRLKALWDKKQNIDARSHIALKPGSAVFMAQCLRGYLMITINEAGGTG